jgi:hypothetical protein
MDYYLSDGNAEDRLFEEWKKYGKIIIAYDFDDTVYDFHKKGRKYFDVINLLQECYEYANLIVFTCCGENEYPKIKTYLNENKIPFDKINENMDFIKFTGRKIYYNIMLDDRAGLSSSYKVLKNTLKKIKENTI